MQSPPTPIECGPTLGAELAYLTFILTLQRMEFMGMSPDTHTHMQRGLTWLADHVLGLCRTARAEKQIEKAIMVCEHGLHTLFYRVHVPVHPHAGRPVAC